MASARGADVTYAGWVFKEGSLVKSWKKRFLVAKRAEIAYYKNTEQENKAQLLGAMTVARIEKVADITNGLLLVSIEGRQLKLFTDTQKECDKCFAAIARYARGQSSVGRDSLASLSDVGTGSDAITHVGWLEKEGQHFKTWKKRYFTLEENILGYSAQIGSTSISKARVIAARRDLSRPNTLVVMLEGGRELKIGGKNEEEIHDWHKALRRAIMKYGGHRSPAHAGRSPGLPGPLASPAAPPPPYSPAFQQQSHRAPLPPPAYVSQRESSAYSLFGPTPPVAAASGATTVAEPSTPTRFSAEQERNMAARQQRGDDLQASFQRHIILEPAADDNAASFVEVEPEKDAVKPWSPKAPGVATIMHMRLEDKLLLEELEEERQEEMQKDQALLTDKGLADKNAVTTAACCCLVM